MSKLGSVFSDILAQATRKTRGITGAVFLDDEGEPIDEYGHGSELDLQITGAHVALVLNKMDGRMGKRGLGQIRHLSLICGACQLLAHRVADVYVVVFVAQSSLPLDRALSQLTRTAQALEGAM